MMKNKSDELSSSWLNLNEVQFLSKLNLGIVIGPTPKPETLSNFKRKEFWAEFNRVQAVSIEFRQFQPSSAEFGRVQAREFGRVRPSSLKFHTAPRFVLGTRIKKQLQAQALSVI